MLKYNTLKYFFWGISVAAILYFFYVQKIYPIFYLSIALVWLIYVIVGAFRMRAEIFLPSVSSLPHASKNTILITFDDGPHPEITPQILTILRQAHAKAIFFCIGKNMDRYPDIVKQIVAEGHLIANHSYNHSNFIGTYSTEKVKAEILQTEETIIKLVGSSLKLYRPPFGVTNPNIARAVSALNMKVVGWNRRSFDTVSKTKEEVLKRITPDLKKGDIVLFHDTNALTPAILTDFLLFASNKGFIFEVSSPFEI